jgi:hypothetical protein
MTKVDIMTEKLSQNGIHVKRYFLRGELRAFERLTATMKIIMGKRMINMKRTIPKKLRIDDWEA